MRSIRVMLTLAFTLMIFLPLSVSRAQDQTKKDDADSAAIEQMVTGYMSDFNHHDAQAISAWFSEDADYTNGGGMLTQTRKGIEEHYVKLFTGSLQRSGVTVKSIRFLSPEIASVDIGYDLTSGVRTSKGLYNWILVKQNGHWLIAILHEIGIGPARPASDTTNRGENK